MTSYQTITELVQHNSGEVSFCNRQTLDHFGPLLNKAHAERVLALCDKRHGVDLSCLHADEVESLVWATVAAKS